MRAVIFIALMIVFISSLFILFIFNTLIEDNLNCIGDPQEETVVTCNMKSYGMDIIIGLTVIGFFVLLDIGAVYLMFSSWTS